MMTRVLAFSGLAVDATATLLSFTGVPSDAHLTAWLVGGTLTAAPLLYQGALLLLEATHAPDVVRWDEIAVTTKR